MEGLGREGGFQTKGQLRPGPLAGGLALVWPLIFLSLRGGRGRTGLGKPWAPWQWHWGPSVSLSQRVPPRAGALVPGSPKYLRRGLGRGVRVVLHRTLTLSPVGYNLCEKCRPEAIPCQGLAIQNCKKACHFFLLTSTDRLLARSLTSFQCPRVKFRGVVSLCPMLGGRGKQKYTKRLTKQTHETQTRSRAAQNRRQIEK